VIPANIAWRATPESQATWAIKPRIRGFGEKHRRGLFQSLSCDSMDIFKNAFEHDW
jgi:hypothetical protein